MGQGPTIWVTKTSHPEYMQGTSSGGKPKLWTSFPEAWAAGYFREKPTGPGGKKKGKRTRATNPHTAHHFHASNRLAAAARIDAWGHKGEARGQR